MKYTTDEIRQLQEDSRGLRTFLLFLILAIIVAAAVYSGVTYWKVPVQVEQEVIEEVETMDDVHK